jgi:hypothetical protein
LCETRFEARKKNIDDYNTVSVNFCGGQGFPTNKSLGKKVPIDKFQIMSTVDGNKLDSSKYQIAEKDFEA